MKYSRNTYWTRHRSEFLKVGLCISIGLCLMAFNYTSHKNPREYEYDSSPRDIDYIITPPPTIHQPKKIQPPPPEPKIVFDEVIPHDEAPIFVEEKIETTDAHEEVTAENDSSSSIMTETPTVAPITIPEPEEDLPSIIADRMPVYNTCELDLSETERRTCTTEKIIETTYGSIQYPPIARESNIEGTVVVSFIVGKDGKVSDIKLVKDIGGGCGHEVIKAIEELGDFYPAKHNGRPVSIIYRLPIKFKLE